MLTALQAGEADVTVGEVRLRGDALAAAAGAVAQRVAPGMRVGVVALPAMETVVAVSGVLAAGGCVVPLNPASGSGERDHVLRDAAPDLVLSPADVDLTARAALPPAPPDDASPAFVVYTSGTTGPPKGVVISRRAIVACLDGLAAAWSWSAADVLAHALPLFHVHGLVLGTLGPLRFGSRLVRSGRFTAVEDVSIYFAVPTMWSRLDAPSLERMRAARLLVSGSAALPAPVSERVRELAGHRLVERYGLTEALIVTAVRPDDERTAGCVGRPIAGARLRIDAADDDGLGEVQLQGATLFTEYLNRPGATADAMTDDGWLRTGDLGVEDAAGGLRLLGRMASDLIKTGGFKVGAGEVEDALLSHPAVAEAAVLGQPDDDLGQRIVAWVVLCDVVDPQEIIDHVSAVAAPHKRPREVRVVSSLPRNAMGKVQKALLS